MWVRVSNAVQDPVTSTALAQDQVVRVVGQEDDWYTIETLEGEKGRLPKVLANEITNPLRSNTETVYCSIAPFEAERQGDLPFGLYTVLVVESAEEDGWLRGVVITDTGKRLGTSGTIPLTYVKQMTGFEAPAAAVNIPTSFTSDFSNDSRFQNVTVSPYARAVYPFKSEFANELSFQADELIQLTKRLDADWLEGSVGGRTGIFPQSFVQIVVPLPGENMEMTEAAPSPSPSSQDAPSSDGIGYAVVRHEFVGRQKDELSVRIGDSIRVVRMANNDWVECRDPATDAVGIVPLSFLELYLDEDDEEVKKTTDAGFANFGSQPFSPGSVGNLSDWRNSTSRSEDSGSSPSSFHPNANNTGWATFGDDWLTPDKKSTPPARPPPPKAVSSPEEALTLTEMFSNVDKAIAHANGITKSSSTTMANWLGTSVTGTDREKRGKVLEELVNTELQFITDMNCFTEAVENSPLLSQKQKAILKSGVAQIVQLAGNLVLGLTNEQGKPYESQTVGACFLSLRKAFAQTYGYYFRNIEQINDLLQKCQTDNRLEGALKGVVRKMQENGATVIDYTTAVSRPIQRCVKYPLFLSELAKYTPIQHTDHPKLSEAIKQMSTLGQKMNESRRRKELSPSSAKKYSEDQPSSSLTDKLSKLTVHSIKKKSNRFTYRMGSSLGVVKVTRDNEFDALVNELDACERRLVRFNYTLVIYKKKIFFETRQLIQKRLVDIRKRQVAMQGIDIEREVQPFHDEVKIFAEMLNSKVRDEIVKALRAIPKKLIKKRNDKLMDWESVKAKERSIGPQNHKFLDFEALNAQVKQTVPKVIEVLHKVLREAMETVKILDQNLMAEMRRLYSHAANAEPSLDSYLSANRLIVPNIPCFVDYYDQNRLAMLQAIVNKAERKARNHAFIAAGVEKASKPRRGSVATVPGTIELPAPISYNTSSATSAPISATSPFDSNIQPGGGKKFRAQTEQERQTILQKAELKDRRKEMYRAMTDWPATKEGLEENQITGRMLICNKGDAVLLVSKQKDGMCVCYNGYYNAYLPLAIIQPWYSETEKNKNSFAATMTRPHSTPPKSQQPTKIVNLIDLDDSPTDSIPALQPHIYPSLTATPFGIEPLAPTTNSAAAPISIETKTSTVPESLFEGVRPVDWGQPSGAPVAWPGADQSNPFETGNNSLLMQRTPSLPNLQSAPSPAFPVTFDDSPKEPFVPKLSHLPPAGPSYSSASVTPTSGQSQSQQDAFTSLWEQIKNQPLSKVTQRSESPQPLIPTRPEPSFLPPTAPPAMASTAMVAPFPPSQLPFDFGAYDTVPSEVFNPGGGAGGAISPPMYSNVPFSSPPSIMYESPPSEMYAQPPSLASYDLPPIEANPINDPYKDKPAIATVQALFDFSSLDQHQINLKAGEKLQLLQAHDDFGSPEWILVRPALGKSGYVPANYCTRC